MPHDFPARHQLGDFLRAAMNVLIAVGELGAELISAPVDVARPPSTYVIDGSKTCSGDWSTANEVV
jgi:hypothetical protein